MAGKNTIQVLRGKITETNKGEKLIEGQPFYNEDRNYLTIGRKGGTASLNSLPITVREVVGYAEESAQITDSESADLSEYSLKYRSNSLKITSPGSTNINSSRGIDINGGNGDAVLRRNTNSSLTLKSDSIEYANNSVSDSAAVNVTTPSTSGFIFKDNGGSNLATVEMGKLKLNSLYDVATGAEQASLSGAGIEVKKNLKVNNILTPAYIGATEGKLNLSYDVTPADPANPGSATLHINTSSPNGKSKINKFVFFAGDGDTDGRASGNSPKADIVVNKVWTTAIDTNSAVINKTLEVKEGASLKQDLDVTGATLSRGDLLFKSHLAFREDGNTNRIIIEKVTSGKNIYLDLRNIRNIEASGIIKTTSSADNAIDASSGTVKAQSFNAVSDRRLKENIVEYSPNKSILDLPIYSYNFISDEKKTKKIGCLAQDLKEICPEIVKEDDNGYLSIEENKIVYLLLDEVKKLKKRVDELEAR